MSKYQPLYERLAGQTGDEWRASYAEIEALLGFPLPKAARSGQAWWAKRGFVARADASTGEVTFRRGDVSPAALQAVMDAPEPENQPDAGRALVEIPGEVAHVVPTRKGWGLIAAAVGGVAMLAGLGIAAGRARRGRA